MKKMALFAALFTISTSALADQFYVSASPHESLTLKDDGSAVINGLCGGGVIPNFHADGLPMLENEHGGPIGTVLRQSRVTASFRGADIVLREGRSQTLFVHSDKPFIVPEVCL
jgi:hypothetical protein